jgi:cytochrome bd-type quinol oxidase subunit 2
MNDMDTQKVSKKGERYTETELMVRLKVFIGSCLAITLIGIVFTVLYSIMFVTQPLDAISPIDSKFFELIIPVATFLCGTLSGIMLAGTGREAALAGAQQANATNAAQKEKDAAKEKEAKSEK